MKPIAIYARLSFLFAVTAHISSCPTLPQHPYMNASIAKWYDGHEAAISITIDNPPRSRREPDVDNYVREQGLVIDYEIVTGNHKDREAPVFTGLDDGNLVYLVSELIPAGFGYFGHGHDHIDHDALPYEDARQSFEECYQTMKDWGLDPVAYAYPRSAGNEEETQRALEASGFLSGRLQAVGSKAPL